MLKKISAIIFPFNRSICSKILITFLLIILLSLIVILLLWFFRFLHTIINPTNSGIENFKIDFIELIITIFISAFILITMMFLSRNITKKIKILHDAIKSIEDNELLFKPCLNNINNTNKLSSNFNNKIKQLKISNKPYKNKCDEIEQFAITLSNVINLFINSMEKLQKKINTKEKIEEKLRANKEALKVTEENYRNLVGYSPIPIFLYRDEKYVYLNSSAIDLHGAKNMNQLLNKSIFDFIHPDCHMLLKEKILNKDNSTKEIKHTELKLIRLDNQIIDIESISLSVNFSGVIAQLVVCKDVTELKKAKDEIIELNKQLEQKVIERTKELTLSNKVLHDTLEIVKQTQLQLIESEKLSALGNLVAGVAHEINTPLGIGVTAASYLEQQTKEFGDVFVSGELTKSSLIKYVQTSTDVSNIILTNLRRAVDMVKSFKQIAVDQSSEQKRVFKMKKYINEILLSLDPKIKITEHIINIHCDEDVEINSYPSAFYQIITNLVMNSFMHGFDKLKKGEINIKIYKDDFVLYIDYTDNGKGIKPENLPKIYEPFFTTKRGRGGSGLGLNIIYNIVTQKLKGKIKCESKVNKGTIFIIQIPLEKELNDEQ